MSKKRREEEAEILKKMYSDGSAADAPQKSGSAPRSAEKKEAGQYGDDEIVRCPKCGYVLTGRTACPRCGYNGYLPMTKKQTRKIKLILYPIFLIAAVLVFLYLNGYFG